VEPRKSTLSTFTSDRVAELDGSGWLAERRAAAAELLPVTLPLTDEEVWRYSRIDELDLDDFAPLAPGAAAKDVPAAVRSLLDAIGPVAGSVVTVNGVATEITLDDAVAAQGVRIGRASELDGTDALVDAVAGDPTDAFGILNRAFAADPVVVHVPRGQVVADPIVVVNWLDAGADGSAVFPHLVVRADENSEVRVLEWYGSEDVAALVVPVVELDADRAARLRYLAVQDLGPRVWQIGTQTSRGGADSFVNASQAALGGDYSRTRIDCRLVGRGATGNLSAISFGEGTQMLDFRTFQDHAAPDTTSNLLFKGAVGGSSRSVYTGLIKVRKEARGTNAFQTNRNIKLSEQAWAESVPNLEIENNDVRCSHASTVGPVDEDQRFYLESRGVPTPVAERLIVAGFFAEVLEQFPVPAVVPLLQERIEARLDREPSVGGVA
jgi:Fe-S cluster assembly protein SufD